MIQTLKKYRFFVLMLPPTLIMFVDLLLGAELPSPVNFLGSCFLNSRACQFLPTLVKKRRNRKMVMKNKVSQPALFGYLCTG